MSHAGFLIFCWLILVLGIALILWFLTRRHSAVFFSVRNTIRILARSLALSLIFAPSIFYHGVVGFPMPASLILAWFLCLPESRDKALIISSRISVVCLLVTWLIFAAVCALSLAWKVRKLERHRETRRDKREVALAISVGVGSLVFCAIWTALAYLFLMAMTFGDGVTGFGPEDVKAVSLPSIYLLLIAISCLPFVRGWPLTIFGAIAHALLAWGFWLLFHNERMSASFVLLLALPFVVIAVGWLALCRERIRVPKEPGCASPRHGGCTGPEGE